MFEEFEYDKKLIVYEALRDSNFEMTDNSDLLNFKDWKSNIGASY